MSTNLLLAIYISVAILGILAALLGIINWIMYSSISSSINEINDELEKRGREFDALKGSSNKPKTYSNTAQTNLDDNFPHSNIADKVNFDEPNEIPQNNLEEPQTPQIDIVRNVRGEFEHPTTGVMKKETVIMKLSDLEDNSNTEESPIETNNNTNENQTENPSIDTITEIEQSTPPIEISGKTVIDNPKKPSDAFQDFSLKRSNINKTNSSDEILDVISEPEDPNKIGNENIKGISIPLYSKAQNDADFKAMWNEIQKVLEDSVIPIHINIDFSNIFFLYKEEMEYLKNIQVNIKNKNCTLGFINCSPDLIKVIWEDNDLGNLIMDI